MKANLGLPVLELLPDGSYLSVLLNPQVSGAARKRLAEAARNGTAAGIDPDPVRPKRTIRAVRRPVADPAFPP